MTVASLLQVISSRELSEWEAFYRIRNPPDPDAGGDIEQQLMATFGVADGG